MCPNGGLRISKTCAALDFGFELLNSGERFRFILVLLFIIYLFILLQVSPLESLLCSAWGNRFIWGGVNCSNRYRTSVAMVTKSCIDLYREN